MDSRKFFEDDVNAFEVIHKAKIKDPSIKELHLARLQLQNMLNETEGWDHIDQAAIKGFVNSKDSTADPSLDEIKIGFSPEAEQRVIRDQRLEEPPNLNSITDDIEAAAKETNTSPTTSQVKAGNYKKGKFTIHGLTVTLENPAGSIRKGKDWQREMAHHYGYINKTEGSDGDHVDVFIGPNPNSDNVYVVDQTKENGDFDEHKCMLGFDSKEEAKKGYLANYPKGWKLGKVTTMSIQQFKDWLEEGDTTKPLAHNFNAVGVCNDCGLTVNWCNQYGGTTCKDPSKNTPKEKLEAKDAKRSGARTRSKETGGDSKEAGSGMEGETKGSGGSKGGSRKEDNNKSVGKRAARAIPATVEEASAKIDRMANFFRNKGQNEVAGWMDKLKDHIKEVGTKEALKELGKNVGKGDNQITQYEGKPDDMSVFAEAYLNRHGISLIPPGGKNDPSQRVISGQSPSYGPQSRPNPYIKGDFSPKDPKFKDKLEESKHLPGLESSEDVSEIMGSKVTHLTKEVTDKLDEKYGKDKWVVKPYGSDAYAGHGIHFPQRVRQLQEDAKSTIWESGKTLAKYGFSHLRNEDGNIIGIKHESGDEYKFMTQKYHNALYGEVKDAANSVYNVRDNEKGAALLNRDRVADGKEYMAQPAFNVVGVSEANRASGETISLGQGRIHLTTKGGKVSVIPHSTWLFGEELPVVFENAETKAMAKSALDTIKSLPRHERVGQIYAADVIKTDKGYRVIEANPANESGSSGYLADNPFIIDSYVSHLTKRTPSHVQFIKGLLTTKKKPTRNVFEELINQHYQRLR